MVLDFINEIILYWDKNNYVTKTILKVLNEIGFVTIYIKTGIRYIKISLLKMKLD